MIYTYPNPDVRRKTEERNAPAVSSMEKHVTNDDDQTAAEDIALNERFVPKDIYSVEFAELAKRLIPYPSFEVGLTYSRRP